MKDLWDLKDLTMHDVKPMSAKERETFSSANSARRRACTSAEAKESQPFFSGSIIKKIPLKTGHELTVALRGG